MYGTVAHLRPKPGQEQAVLDLFNEWNRDYKPQVKGAITSYAYRKEDDPGELIMVAVFEDKQSYLANADSPEQNEWYQKFRELLEVDPSWEDGEIVASG